jgi:hypothetical protein
MWRHVARATLHFTPRSDTVGVLARQVGLWVLLWAVGSVVISGRPRKEKKKMIITFIQLNEADEMNATISFTGIPC